MAEPKGTYYSPNETGLATVLRPGPNFMGIAQQYEANKQRTKLFEAQQKQKEEAERERQINRLVSDLSRPTPTAFPYQEEVNKSKSNLLSEVGKMYLDGADAAEIRFKVSAGVQELTGYAKAGSDVYKAILEQTKQLDKKKYRIPEITKGLASKLVGETGSIVDPQTVDMRDVNAAGFVYESDRPWDYLNQNVVVKDFLKNDKFKETVSEIQQNLDAGRIGRFTTFNEKTTINKGISSLYDINAISGEVKVNDPETLITNGVFQLAMNDRDMAAVIEGEVEKLTADRTTPLEGTSRDLLRASVLQDLLVNATPGPTTIERVSQKVAPTYTSSGGKQTQGEKNTTEYAQGLNLWQTHVSSQDPKLVKQSLDYMNVQLGISEDARTALTEAVGAEADWDFQQVEVVSPEKAAEMIAGPGGEVREPGIYAVFKDRNKTKYKKVDQEQLAGVFGSQIYATTFKRTGKNYLEALDVPVVPQTGKYNKRK